MAKDQDLISLSKTTPDGLIKSKDKVRFIGNKSKYGVPLSAGEYYFDSYDTDDGTCFICKDKEGIVKKIQNSLSKFCYWVDLDELEVIE